MKIVAFIGLGTMGQSMASNILKKGYQVICHTRNSKKPQKLIEMGASWSTNIYDAVVCADYVITMVGDQNDVRDIYLGEKKILEKMKKGSILIDMTTSSPKLAKEIYEKAYSYGISALDAPVTGGPAGAMNGSLTIMVGGDAEALDQSYRLLNCMGQNIIHYGPAGNGQKAKLVNQTVGMLNMIGAIEGLFFAKKTGLDVDKILQMLQSGLTDSKSLRGAAPMALKNEFSLYFHPKHVVKDLTLAIEESESLGLDLQMLKTARAQWMKLMKNYPNAGAVNEIARLYQ